MKPLLLILLFTLLVPVSAHAEFYKWTDDDGVFHMVDDLHKVPQKDREKLGLDLKALEEEIRAPEKSIIKPMTPDPVSPPEAYEQNKRTDPANELYDGKTLEWWVKTFNRVRREKSELKQSIDAKEEYNGVFLGGRKFGTIYTQKSIDRYNRNIKALPGDKERLIKKETYIEKLTRKAKNAGVPRNVRGD